MIASRAGIRINEALWLVLVTIPPAYNVAGTKTTASKRASTSFLIGLVFEVSLSST